jgi:hypothetical protein
VCVRYQGRLKISEAKYQDREEEVQNREHRIERENANIKNELRAAQLHVDRLRRRLEEREIEIDKLRSIRKQNRCRALILSRYELCLVPAQRKKTHLFILNFRNGISSDESFNCRTSSLRPDFHPTEERRQSSLIAVSPRRGLDEPNEYVTLALAAEAERVRLLELVAVLNQRLDKERNEADALAVSQFFLDF